MSPGRIFHLVVNLVGFKVGWLSCVLGAASGRPWLGPLVVAGLAAVHVSVARSRGRELMLLAGAAAIGYAADSLLVMAGVMSFPPGTSWGGPSAGWMVALWVNLALLLHVSMSWLSGRYLLAAVLGAISGPMAYFAGARLGAVSVDLPLWVALSAFAIEWAIALPVLVRLADLTASPAPEPAPAELAEAAA